MKAPNVFHIIFSKIFSNLTKCGRSSSSRTSSVTSHASFGTSRFLNHSTAAYYYPNYFPILSNEGSKRFSQNIFQYCRNEVQTPTFFKNFKIRYCSIQVNNYDIVVIFFHISHNLTWYSEFVNKFTRIYLVCTAYELTKQFWKFV